MRLTRNTPHSDCWLLNPGLRADMHNTSPLWPLGAASHPGWNNPYLDLATVFRTAYSYSLARSISIYPGIFFFFFLTGKGEKAPFSFGEVPSIKVQPHEAINITL